jgi:hypothetical protein
MHRFMLYRKKTTKPAKQRKIMVQKTTPWKSAIVALPLEPNQDEGGENSQPGVAEKPRWKRGRPRKIVAVAPIDTIKEQFVTKKIAAAVNSKRRRKPSAQKMSPYKSP